MARLSQEGLLMGVRAFRNVIMRAVLFSIVSLGTSACGSPGPENSTLCRGRIRFPARGSTSKTALFAMGILI